VKVSKICVVGGGYVGIPTAAILAKRGNDVVLAESNLERYRVLSRGDVPIYEPGLDALVKDCIQSGNLSISSSAVEAVHDCDFVFLCVPTPQSEDGSADLSIFLEAAREIAKDLKPGAIVVNKSTVPVGTASIIEKEIGRADVNVVSNPEFLREGTAVEDSLHPDRIVVGGANHHVAQRVAELFSTPGAALVITNSSTAESIKYASNAFLATKISFVNEIAAFCDAVGADIQDLVLGMGFDHRIGFEFMQPGPGWGGSCFPKDTRALVKIGEKHGYDFSLVRGAIDCNEEQRRRVVRKVESMVGDLSSSRIGIWGLTFKANTDDRRSSPAIAVTRELLARGASVQAFDPTVKSTDKAEDLEGISVATNAIDAARDADALVVLTEWQEFRWADFAHVGSVMNASRLLDARNMLDPEALKRLGFAYMGMGRS
jgi:UDPglucose 6-dehydrogenase